MSKMVQIRHVPDDVHRVLKARAARMGMSLSDYLRLEITRLAERPTLDEALDRIALRKRPTREVDAVGAVRAEREGR